MEHIMNNTLKSLYENLSIEIKTKSDVKCFVELGKMEDINEILACYDSVWINSLNINEKLDKNSEHSFYKSGGIFNKLTIDQINKIMNSNTDTILVSKINNCKGDINSLLWLSINTDMYNNICYYDDIDSHTLDMIEEYKSNNQIIYPMDFIALPESYNRGIAYPLLHLSYDKLYGLGYKYAFVEIYTLLGYYNKSNNYYQLNLENHRSVLLNTNIGAQKIGTIGTHKYKKGEYTVVVRSEVYGLELSKTIKIMKEKIKEQILSLY